MDRKSLGKKLVKEAGGILMKYFGQENIATNKGLKDIVLDTDLEAENHIISIIKSNLPEDSIFSEEAGILDNNSQYRWIIDPLDGTANFKANIPYFCVSIGLEKDGVLEMAFIYDPNRDDYFFAQKGRGAFLNDSKIAISKEGEVNNFLFSYSTSNHKSLEVIELGTKVFNNILSNSRALRLKGSSILDLCNLASGIFDGLVKVGANYWDFAPGCLLVEEAGGIVTDFQGNAWDESTENLIASNGIRHEDLIKVIVPKI